MITRVLVLAMVLAVTLAVTTPALAAKRVPEHPDWEVTKNGFLIEGGDVVFGKCTTLIKQWHSAEGSTRRASVERWASVEEGIRACQAAGYTAKGLTTRQEPQAPLSKTGGPPLILVPIALLIVSGLLIRKSTAL